jgi:hypothetical protein
MRPKYERSSGRKSLPRRRRALAPRWLIVFWIALPACGPAQAQVGSGFPPDAAPGPCNAFASLRLYYWSAHPGDTTNQIDFVVKIENGTGAPIPSESLKVRYFFTNELSPPTTLDIFYADTCCSNKKVGFLAEVQATLATIAPKPGADSYIELGFTPNVGLLAPGDALQVEPGFHDPSFARMSTQTNDYSYVPTAVGAQPEWDQCPGPQCEAKFTSCTTTLYRDGALVWGTLP